MISQGSIISIKFNQGDFEPAKFSNLSVINKAFSVLLLTIFGIIMAVPLELLDSMKKILALAGLLLGGHEGQIKI